MERGAGQRVVRFDSPSVRLQLPAEQRREQHRDVAGGELRPRRHRARTAVGGRARLQLGARVPAVHGLGGRPGGPEGAPGDFSEAGRRGGHLDDADSVRRLPLRRPRPLPGAPGRAQAGGAQQPLDAEPRLRGGRRPGALAAARSLRHRLGGGVRQRPAGAAVGPVQRAGRGSSRGEPAAGGGGVPLGARRGAAAAADRGVVFLARLHDRNPAVRRTQLRRGLLPLLRQPERDAGAPRRAGGVWPSAAVHGVAGAPPRLQVRQPPAAVPRAQHRQLPVGAGRRADPDLPALVHALQPGAGAAGAAPVAARRDAARRIAARSRGSGAAARARRGGAGAGTGADERGTDGRPGAARADHSPAARRP